MSYELSTHVKDEIEHWKARFPEDRQRSAVISALHAVQHENQGFVSAEQMNAVAEYLDLPTIQVYEVATFYSMFQTSEVGRNEVAICTNISCMLRGADEIVEECIAACCGAPAMMVNHKYHENLTKAQIDEILDGLD